MKKIAYISIATLFTIIVIVAVYVRSSHTPDSIVEQKLFVADSLMFIKPDSSLSILEGMKSNRFDKHNRALHALLLSQARSRNYIIPENDSLINIALDYFTMSNDSIRKAWTYVYASDVYTDLSDKQRGLEYIQKAATTAQPTNDNRLLCFIYYFWGRLLQDEKPYQVGIDKILKSEEYARKLNDTSLIINRLEEVTLGCLYDKNYTLATQLISKGIDIAKEANMQNKYTLLYKRLALLYLETEKYDKALETINKALQYYKYLNNTGDLRRCYSMKGSILIKLNEIDSARHYINLSKSNATFYSKAHYNGDMALLEEKLGNYKDALKYREAYANLLDSIKIDENDKRIMALQKKYDLTVVKSENDKLKIDKSRTQIYLLITLLALLCIIFASFIYRSHLKKRIKNIIHAKDQILTQGIANIQKKSNSLLLKQEIEIAELNDNLLHKKEELYLLHQKHSEFQKHILSMNDAIMKIESIKEVNEKNKIKNSATFSLSTQELESMISVLNLCFDNFTQRLRESFPDLNSDDIYLCSLLKMGVSNQNIAILLNINESTLKKRKYRLKNDKLNLNDDEVTLESFIEQF